MKKRIKFLKSLIGNLRDLLLYLSFQEELGYLI